MWINTEINDIINKTAGRFNYVWKHHIINLSDILGGHPPNIRCDRWRRFFSQLTTYHLPVDWQIQVRTVMHLQHNQLCCFLGFISSGTYVSHSQKALEYHQAFSPNVINYKCSPGKHQCNQYLNVSNFLHNPFWCFLALHFLIQDIIPPYKKIVRGAHSP